MFLQSRLQCLFVLAPSADDRFPAVRINPGETVRVEREHFDSVLKGNRALEALVSDRKLVPTEQEPHALDAHALTAASVPEAPAQLRDAVPDVTIKGKVEIATADLSEPLESKRRK
jgi:hypothetical protein